MIFAWIILSKDRAFQLDALLRSMETCVHPRLPIYVFYAATGIDHINAYFEVFSRHANLISGVVVDKNFRQGLSYLMAAIDSERVAFLMDDQLFISPVDIHRALIFDPSQAIFSFRLGRRITECQPMGNLSVPLPEFYDVAPPGYLAWKWADAKGDWGCKSSLDGNIFRRSQVLKILGVQEFYGPQSLEIALYNDMLSAELGVCEEVPSLINLAINRVSDEDILFPSGNQYVELLLKKWNDGLQIDIKKIFSIRPNACHVILDVPIEARNKDQVI